MSDLRKGLEKLAKYHFNFSRWNGEEKCEVISLPGEFYLASDLDALLAADTEGPGLREVEGEWTFEKACRFVNMDHPAIASLLYDLDLMPEQIISDENRANMILIVAHMMTLEGVALASRPVEEQAAMGESFESWWQRWNLGRSVSNMVSEHIAHAAFDAGRSRRPVAAAPLQSPYIPGTICKWCGRDDGIHSPDCPRFEVKNGE